MFGAGFIFPSNEHPLNVSVPDGDPEYKNENDETGSIKTQLTNSAVPVKLVEILVVPLNIQLVNTALLEALVKAWVVENSKQFPQ